MAAITGVTFPDRVDLNETGDLPAGTVWIKAADLDDAVTAGATDLSSRR